MHIMSYVKLPFIQLESMRNCANEFAIFIDFLIMLIT